MICPKVKYGEYSIELEAVSKTLEDVVEEEAAESESESEDEEVRVRARLGEGDTMSSSKFLKTASVELKRVILVETTMAGRLFCGAFCRAKI